jgi:hypothetical protein
MSMSGRTGGHTVTRLYTSTCLYRQTPHTASLNFEASCDKIPVESAPSAPFNNLQVDLPVNFRQLGLTEGSEPIEQLGGVHDKRVHLQKAKSYFFQKEAGLATDDSGARQTCTSRGGLNKGATAPNCRFSTSKQT